MPRRATPLTWRQVETKPEGNHADGNGLYLIVSATKMRTWEFRYSFGDKRRYMGLGGINKWSLAEVREHVRELQKKISAGVDPIEERKQQRKEAAAPKQKQPTFRQCAEACIEDRRAEWRSDHHAAQWTASLTKYVYPLIGDMPVKDIVVNDVLMVLKPIWRVVPETASRIRNRIEAVIDWAVAQEYRSEDIANPAHWGGRLKVILRSADAAAAAKRRSLGTPEHFRSLSYTETPQFMSWLRATYDKSTSASLLEFVILTASRIGSARRAEWREINFDSKLWTVPASKMKAGKEHRVPLSDQAVEVLLRMRANNYRDSQYVFPGERDHPNDPISDNTPRKLIERSKYASAATVHGFRGTFRKWVANQKTRFSWNAAEAALAHELGKVAGAYQDDDLLNERREIMRAWGDFVSSSGTVVPFKRAAAG